MLYSPTIPVSFSSNKVDSRRRFAKAFHHHFPRRTWAVASTKFGAPFVIQTDRLHLEPFLSPPPRICGAIVLDLDRDTAGLEAFTVLPSAPPSWVIETTRGAQAGWFIEPVPFYERSREKPQEFAKAVGYSMREAYDGDRAVHPLFPSRCRNPLFVEAEVYVSANPPIYKLGILSDALKGEGFKVRSRTALARDRPNLSALTHDGSIPEGSRNKTVFDACRFAAYRGNDFEAAAWDAYEHCDAGRQPFSQSEVVSIIASVDRFMKRQRTRQSTSASTPMPDQMRDALSEMGRRGGLRNTDSQRAARKQGLVARRSASERRSESIRRMAIAGRSNRKIADELGISTKTVQRTLRSGHFGASGL